MWNLKYQELANFYKKHGHLRVELGGCLYRWMGTQRKRRRGVKGLAPLTDEQIQLLDDIDFVWNVWNNSGMGCPKNDKGRVTKDQNPERRGYCEKRWNLKYQELANFYKKHGHLRVELGGSLCRWIRNQRQNRKGAKRHTTPITDEQIQLLDEIGFVWEPVDLRWNSKYQELAKFFKKHGHLNVEYNGSLYRWMATQRQKRRDAKGLAPLTDKQIQLLDDIDFIWNFYNPRAAAKPEPKFDSITGKWVVMNWDGSVAGVPGGEKRDFHNLSKQVSQLTEDSSMAPSRNTSLRGLPVIVPAPAPAPRLWKHPLPV